MNNESTPPGNLSPKGPESQTTISRPINLQKLSPEELKVYKDCALSMYYKGGIPFATFIHLLTYWRTPGMDLIPKSFNRSVFVFIGNVILGSFLFSPVCYIKLLAKHAEIEAKKKEMQDQNLSVGEVFPTSQLQEDFSYPSDLVSSLNEPESNFSSDFNLLGPLIDEAEEKKMPATTYQELRKKHRSSYTNKSPSSFNIEQDRESSTLSPPTEASKFSEPLPRRIVKKNKYGDEME